MQCMTENAELYRNRNRAQLFVLAGVVLAWRCALFLTLCCTSFRFLHCADPSGLQALHNYPTSLLGMLHHQHQSLIACDLLTALHFLYIPCLLMQVQGDCRHPLTSPSPSQHNDSNMMTMPDCIVLYVACLLLHTGPRGLQALTDLNISLTPPPATSSSSYAPSSSSRSSSPIPGSRSTSPTPGSSIGTILSPDAAAAVASTTTFPQQQQQHRDLGAASGIATASYAEDAAAISGLVGGVRPPSGLLLLQGMLLLGPGRVRRVETYGKAAAAAACGAAGLAVPAGIGA
jgi:hypothetical protein